MRDSKDVFLQSAASLILTQVSMAKNTTSKDRYLYLRLLFSNYRTEKAKKSWKQNDLWKIIKKGNDTKVPCKSQMLFGRLHARNLDLM